MSRLGHLLVIMAAVVLCNVCSATLEVDTAEVSVVYPNSFAAKKTFKMAMADFGKPKYGGFQRAELVYFSSKLRSYQNKTYRCHPRDCEYACDFNTSIPPAVINKTEGTAYIVMVDRGPRDTPDLTACFFLDKVYNAQMLGADAVLVADDKDEELTTVIAPDMNDESGEREAVSVPAGFISLKDADYLRALLNTSQRVELLLNWTGTLPQSLKVEWEFWTGSEDVCGAVCQERVNFTASIKSQAIKFEQAALTKFTPRYYLEKCTAGTENTTECQSNCFSNGRYCASPNINDITGQDVLRMNLRGMCFFQLADKAGKGYLWWEYAARFAADCSIAKSQYNAECAGKVFDAVNVDNALSRSLWETCFNIPDTNATTIDILERERISQNGNTTAGNGRTVSPVIINPTIRINGVQYRGSLRAGEVLRALCAAFPSGFEPPACNDPWITENECAPPDGVGYKNCRVGEFGVKTGCINTFAGYQCTCGDGFEIIMSSDAISEKCADVNECLLSQAPYKNASCSCARCACINTVGSYECSGEKPNICTAENKYGGCWNQAYELTYYGKMQMVTKTTCVDTIVEYKERAQRGILNKTTDKWYKCGDCPPCFRKATDCPADRNGDCCELICKDIADCDPSSGFCFPPKADGGKTAGGDGGGGDGSGGGASGGGGSGGGGGGGSSSKSSGGGGGVHPGFVVLAVLGAAALTGGIVFAANHIMMKRRMSEEIHDIMSSYMPLQADRTRSAAVAGRGGPSGGGPQERIIRPDEDSDEEGNMGAYGWSTGPRGGGAAAAAAAVPAGPGGGSAAAAAPTLVGATQRSVWGPPSGTSAAPPGPASGGVLSFGSPISPSSGPAAPKLSGGAAAAAKPTVTAFGGGPASAEGPSAAAAAAAPAADADPLLGRALTSSTSLEPPNPAGKPAERDNPFL